MLLKVLLKIVVLLLVAATTTAQRSCPRCPQEACPASCEGNPNVGISCPSAAPRRMWYYDPNSRTCRPMSHLGCGGNANRWCSESVCVLRCVRTLG